MVLYRIGIPC